MTVTESSVEQQEIVAAVREFVDRDVIPVASELDHRDEFPNRARRDDEGRWGCSG